MAKIETIINVQGKPMRIFNLHNKVGVKGVNEMDDVMVIKALLRYIHWDPNVCKMTGLRSSEIPSPYDGTIYGLPAIIKKFQKGVKTIKFLSDYKIIADGGVSPAKQSAVNGGIYYTIAALNSMAIRLAYTNGGTETHIEAILRTYQHLQQIEEDDGSFVMGGY